MKFSVLILPETSCIEVVINVFKQVMGYEMASPLYKDYDLRALDFTLNSLNV
jgi:hypothetical protein